jgi:hypothetical protein
MTFVAPTARRVVLSAVAVLMATVVGFAGTAHAHGTHTAPPEPHLPTVHTHHGPFSVLREGPYSVLRQAG